MNMGASQDMKWVSWNEKDSIKGGKFLRLKGKPPWNSQVGFNLNLGIEISYNLKCLGGDFRN
jgi:hypothetical protein